MDARMKRVIRALLNVEIVTHERRATSDALQRALDHGYRNAEEYMIALVEAERELREE